MIKPTTKSAMLMFESKFVSPNTIMNAEMQTVVKMM